MLLYDARRKIDQGFTLVEVITVIIIVGAIAAIAAPNFLGLLNQTRVKDGLSQVEGAIKESQRLAIRRGKTCKIKFETKTIDGYSRETMNIVDDEAGNDYSGCILSERVLPKDVTVNAGSITKIAFTGKGNVIDSSTGTIIIAHPASNTQKCLQIEGLLGNIATGDYDSTATPKCQAK